MLRCAVGLHRVVRAADKQPMVILDELGLVDPKSVDQDTGLIDVRSVVPSPDSLAAELPRCR
jgi:hypothetical protein